MRRDKAEKLANRLLWMYGLTDWFAFCLREPFLYVHERNAKGEVVRKAAGFCAHQDKAIFIHPHFVELNSDDDVISLILHEIAHALTPNDHGHGPEWKRVAQKLGRGWDRRRRNFLRGPEFNSGINKESK